MAWITKQVLVCASGAKHSWCGEESAICAPDFGFVFGQHLGQMQIEIKSNARNAGLSNDNSERLDQSASADLLLESRKRLG